jgi:non-specific protein-tyrosine kinase
MDIRSYISIIRKWLWLVVLCSVIAGAAAFFFSRQQTPIYQSTATVFINQARSSTGNSDYTDIITSERIARTYAAMLQDWPTLDQAAIALGYPGGVAELSQAFALAVTVTPVRDTQLVRVTVDSSHPEVAAGVANNLPEVFMQMNRARQQQRFADTRQDLQTELASTELELEQARLALVQLADTEENKNERDRASRPAFKPPITISPTAWKTCAWRRRRPPTTSS